MGKARSIVLDTITFERVGDANDYFKSILYKHPINSYIRGADADDIYALLKRHDEMEEKIGVGIDHFEVAPAPDGYPGKCFWIIRKDGSRIDFSFKNCLERKTYD